jgi:spore germination cell wall hydrolase CwlJ-like protein
MSDAELAIARTIYEEARGEGAVGMQAVAEVIFNRIGHAGYGRPKSALDVVSARGQFLGFKGSVAPSPIEAIPWAECSRLARKLAKGEAPGTAHTSGAHAFHKASSAAGLVGPAWNAVHTCKIGAHNFFRIVPKA